jgi:hypothetical protein
MLTGRRAFHAETAAETMAAVLMKEPDLSPLGRQPEERRRANGVPRHQHYVHVKKEKG